MLKTKLPLSLPVLALPILLVIASAVLVDKSTNAQVLCRVEPTSVVSSVEQAKCLLREPRIWGEVGSKLTSLPSPLDRLLSKPTIDLTKEQLRKYLLKKGIREADIGGSLDNPVSHHNENEVARYFVIHDTSSPNFRNAPFPNNINEATWSGNDLKNATKVAHVFINRVGQSITKNDFKIPFRATVFEMQTVQRKGLFLNVELVQPRKCKPDPHLPSCNSEKANDAIAPDPGFTQEQLNRLALVYIAASVRRGKWLIPAFHVALDQGVGDHDDPQHFNLDQWAKQLETLLNEIRP